MKYELGSEIDELAESFKSRNIPEIKSSREIDEFNSSLSLSASASQ